VKEGDLLINVTNDRPVVVIDSNIQTINYGTVSSNIVKVLNEGGKIVPIEIKMLRRLDAQEKN
jgi:hypothetical protein